MSGKSVSLFLNVCLTEPFVFAADLQAIFKLLPQNR